MPTLRRVQVCSQSQRDSYRVQQTLPHLQAEQISVLVPLNTTHPLEPMVPASFNIPSLLSPSQFLEEVRRLMGIAPGLNVRLGYRTIPCPRSEAFVRFETASDVENAVAITLTRKKRAISRAVQLEICNFVSG